ncbi:sushi domain-containing protein 1, partial [Elysia marginata]
DCGNPPPSVQHGMPSVRETTYGAVVVYNCEPGYKLSTPGANVTCLASGKWDTPTFTCDKAAGVPQLNPASLSGLSSLFSASGPGGNTPSGNPSDLMALATAGLGSNNPAAAPRSLSELLVYIVVQTKKTCRFLEDQLIGTMNPLQALMGGAGMGGLGGMSPGGPGGAGGPGMAPDPEKAAEQREESEYTPELTHCV